jgi:uncharacterized protein with PIN domain
MATFLVRYLEAGRDAQRGGQRRDLAAALEAQVPGARIESETGRLIVETDDAAAARAALEELSGIASFSPCTRVAREDLDAAVVTCAAAIPPGGSFRIRSASRELAARLGGVVLAARPDVRVDLHTPDRTIGVELRGELAFVFDEVVPGRDRRGRALAQPGEEPRFVADQMLGRLATWLRLLGYDTVHPWDQPDSWVIRVARDEGRIILTRDGPLAQITSTPVHFVRAQRPSDQLLEVVRAFGLVVDDARMFTRCPRCNVAVDEVPFDTVKAQVPTAVASEPRVYRRCPQCARVYWRGGHVERMLDHLRDVLDLDP